MSAISVVCRGRVEIFRRPFAFFKGKRSRGLRNPPSATALIEKLENKQNRRAGGWEVKQLRQTGKQAIRQASRRANELSG